jgi:hypothetical protein
MTRKRRREKRLQTKLDRLKLKDEYWLAFGDLCDSEAEFEQGVEVLQRCNLAWKRITWALAQLARQKGYDAVEDPVYAPGAGSDRDLMVSLESIADTLGVMIGLD